MSYGGWFDLSFHQLLHGHIVGFTRSQDRQGLQDDDAARDRQFGRAVILRPGDKIQPARPGDVGRGERNEEEELKWPI